MQLQGRAYSSDQARSLGKTNAFLDKPDESGATSQQVVFGVHKND